MLMASSWNWRETPVGKMAQNSGYFGRFLAFVNSLFNEDHAWFNYDEKFPKESSALENFLKGQTGSGLTNADIQANELQMQNVEDQYGRQVAGMQKAGLNPALMYQNGASSSAPSVQPSQQTGSMSELMQLITLPMQMKMMNAQIANVNSQTDKNLAESDQIKQIMDWYPNITQKTIDEIVSRTGLNFSNISKNRAEKEIMFFEKIIKENEAKESSAFFKARREYEEAKTPQAKAAAAADLARAAWDEYQTSYTKEHDGAMPSSSSILALVNAISSWLDVKPGEIGAQVTDAITSVASDVKGVYDKGLTAIGNTKPGGFIKRQVKKFAPKTFDWFKRQIRQ